MKTLASLLMLAVAPALASAQATSTDLKRLAKAGVSEEVLLAYLKTHGYQGKPSSDELVELKEAGIGDKVLVELLSRSETPVAASRTVHASGTWSVRAPYYPPRTYVYPVYRRYYTGVIGRGVVLTRHCGPWRHSYRRCR